MVTLSSLSFTGHLTYLAGVGDESRGAGLQHALFALR